MSDNFHFDLTGVPLEKCLDIAFGGSASKRATHWLVQGPDEGKQYPHTKHGTRLLLAWVDPKGTGGDWIPFPAPLTAEQAVETVKSWLNTADYGNQPDHDGDNGRGWRIYNESWGHVDGMWQAFVAIEPAWLMYGK